jgi:hypothetical protein
MLAKIDDASANIVEIELTDAEAEIFSQARIAGDGLRKSFDRWLTLGRGVAAARAIADRLGGKGTFGRILDQQGLGWLNTRGKTSVFYLEAMVRDLPKVLKWREGLDERSRIKWASPQSIYLRCLRPGNRPAHGPRVTPKPMTVREFLHLSGASAAQLLYDRSPSKAWALKRALDELLGSGTAPKPRSGWSLDRDKRAAADASAAAA